MNDGLREPLLPGITAKTTDEVIQDIRQDIKDLCDRIRELEVLDIQIELK